MEVSAAHGWFLAGDESSADSSKVKATRKTPFSCFARLDGYYADVDTECRQFHVCDNYQQFRLSCPRATRFHQPSRTCTPVELGRPFPCISPDEAPGDLFALAQEARPAAAYADYSRFQFQNNMQDYGALIANSQFRTAPAVQHFLGRPFAAPPPAHRQRGMVYQPLPVQQP